LKLLIRATAEFWNPTGRRAGWENVDMTVINSFLGDYEWSEFAQQ
jgi:hypothetical protein